MPPNLADDRRHRVAGDVDTAIDVEAIDRLDESDGSDLHEILERLPPAGVARGERTHEWHELHEHLIASTLVPVAVIRDEELLHASLHRVNHRRARNSLPSPTQHDALGASRSNGALYPPRASSLVS